MRRWPALRGALALALALPWAPPALAQVRAPAGAVVPAAIPDSAGRGGAAGDSSATRIAGPAPLWAPVASALLPGVGQAAMRQPRAAAYLALELYTWLQYRESRRDVQRARGEYRRIARVSARPCGESCPDGNWDYYERLEDPSWVGSGAYDVVPGGALDPEMSPDTYNGTMWALARSIYGENAAPGSVAYQQALAFYAQRAYGPEFAWSWRDRQQQLGEYRQAIERANEANRMATTALGVVIANRVLSLVDGFVTLRVRRLGPGAPAEFSAALPWERVPGLRRPRR